MTDDQLALMVSLVALGVVGYALVLSGRRLLRPSLARDLVDAPRALAVPPRPVAIDPEYLLEQLQDSITRSPGHQKGDVRLGVVTISAQWVLDSWRDRWRVTIRAGKAEIAVPVTYTDEAMYAEVLRELRQLAGGTP